MNKKLALPAIAMFAVIMGIAAVAPAMAAPGNDKSQATAGVCHFFVVYQWDDLNENGIRDYVDPDAEDPVLEPLILVEVEDPETGEITLEPIADPALSLYGVLYVNSNGQANGHVNGHGDEIVDDSDEPVEGSITTDVCLAKNL